MHFLTSLIIFSGFVFVVGLGLVKVIWDLSEMSVHAPPNVLAAPFGGAGGAEEGHANITSHMETHRGIQNESLDVQS
jgi:hypothetical protein